jgi:hypothetical protein
MSNPFETSAPAPAARQTTPTQRVSQAAGPDFGNGAAAPAPRIDGTRPNDSFAPPATTGGDPFAMPTGGGSGEKISEMVGELLLVKPTEFVEGITTRLGPADAVRADLVILSDVTGRQGDVCPGLLVFQTALMRDLVRVLSGPTPYLLGRLAMGKEQPGKNAPYIFDQPTDEDMVLARQYLAARSL